MLDNCDDSTRDNWGVFGGVQGSLPAYPLMEITPTSTVSINLMSSVVPYNDFILPVNDQWYEELGGTADVGTSSGDAYKGIVMSGAGIYGAVAELYAEKSWLFSGIFHYFMRAGVVSGADLAVTVKPYVVFSLASPGTKAYGTSMSVTLTTTYKGYYLGSVSGNLPVLVLDHQKRIHFGIDWEWGAGAAHTGKVDYMMVINGEIAAAVEPIPCAGWSARTRREIASAAYERKPGFQPGFPSWQR